MLERYVFLSHDVDWRLAGPPKQHILDIRERFEQSVIDNIDSTNPYDNFEQIMDIEEKHGCRSTFFFRTVYEGGDLTEYKTRINELESSGWEIGLHLDPGSIHDMEKIKKEYDDLSGMAKNRIIGNRVHYLNYDEAMLDKLARLGILYDSSIMPSRSDIIAENYGYIKKNIVQFPITVADVFMYRHHGVDESNMLSYFDRILEKDDRMMSIIWHDNVLRMKGGRMYGDVIRHLESRGAVFCTGREMLGMIQKGKL